ncbi:MAG: DUF4198 domain-containing protein [Pyrinomonadaceae bacterium]|nr:DUF4198 domain-containing protein [Pyrinomonadaceae bacterium]
MRLSISSKLPLGQIAAALVTLVLSSSAFAHEYWFEAGSFFLRPTEVTSLRLFVGEALRPESEIPFQASKTNSFQMFAPNGTFDMRTMAEDERKPIVNFSADQSGTYVLAMERGWSYITLEADKFEEYLKEDGLEDIVSERERLGETKKPGRERYSRYVKTMVQVGGNRTGNAKSRYGGRFEIVALDNPYSKKIGDTIQFQIFFGGATLGSKTVFADNRDGDVVTTRKFISDKDGRIAVKLDRKGIWLIRLVHMQRCLKACGDADWESFWGALSFGVK